MAKKSSKGPKQVAALTHEEAKRKNIPTAEMQSLAERVEEMRPVPPAHYPRATPLAQGETRPRDGDLDPQIIWNGVRIRLSKEQIRALEEKGQIEIGEAQLVWRGKDTQDWSDLIVQVPPLYIQDKIHPKVIIDDLIRRTKEKVQEETDAPDLFADFNGIDPEAKLEFYQHDQHWSNRMILGDSLQVMASLTEREGLRGKVQCIYIDPPYGIKFNSNWQVSTQSRDVGADLADISRDPEQVKAFRDTWKDGIHSYLTYLRDRLTVAKELLADSGSIFVQIGEENVHRIRAVMEEVFGAENFVSQINVRKTATPTSLLDDNFYYLLWFARDLEKAKFRNILADKPLNDWVSETRGGSWGVRTSEVDYRPLTADERRDPDTIPVGSVYALSKTNSAGASASPQPLTFEGKQYLPGSNAHWKSAAVGMNRLVSADRLEARGGPPWFRKFHADSPFKRMTNAWLDTSGKSTERWYVVQTDTPVIQRCVLMTTDPGDLVLDPTCGSGTTATVAEQWGRRWITIDTSRVALALARARIMGARYSYYFLADSAEGRAKEQDITGKIQTARPTQGDIRQGFVYDRAPHITLKSIANNAEIDVIWEASQKALGPLRAQLNEALGESFEEWQVPREADAKWGANVKALHNAWWDARIARQKKIDDSITRNADIEYLYDKPYEDKSRVRVAGPFTVESLSPHRVVPADEAELLDLPAGKRKKQKFATPPTDFAEMVLENF